MYDMIEPKTQNKTLSPNVHVKTQCPKLYKLSTKTHKTYQSNKTTNFLPQPFSSILSTRVAKTQFL